MKCGICNEDFMDNDDVVVCPECGTPMHRQCYVKEKHCPNESLHSENFVYEKFENIKNSAKGISDNNLDNSEVTVSDVITCQYCGEKNKKTAVFCNRCGMNIAQTREETNARIPNSSFSAMMDPLAGIPSDTEFEEDVTAADMACYVRVNTPYYLRAFNAVKSKSNKFNFSAAIFSGVWFLYRKQYKLGGIFLAIDILIFALQYFLTFTFSYPVITQILKTLGITSEIDKITYSQYIEISEYISTLPPQQLIMLALPYISVILFIILAVVLGKIGNKLYYKDCVEKIRKIKLRSVDDNVPSDGIPLMLSAAGGVNTFVALIFFFIYFFYFFL